MVSLLRIFQVSKSIKINNGAVLCAVRNAHDVVIKDDDWKAGPYPKTQQEREAAAKKYGIPPELYEAYPDDGDGVGDYPKLPMLSADSKSPWYPWDFPEYRRNFNEPLHFHANLIGEDRVDVSKRWRYSRPVQLLTFLTFVGSLFGIYMFLEDKKAYRPVLAKHFARNGKPCYTFEPAN